MRKKLLALFLVFALLATMGTPGLAKETNSKLSMEEALAIAKEVIELPAAAAKNMDVQYYEGAPGKEQGSTWNFNWHMESPGVWQWFGVSIDANTGTIRSLNQDDGNLRRGDKYKDITPIDKEEAKALAEEFLIKYANEIFKEAAFVEGMDEQIFYDKGASYTRYNFRYERKINGVSTDEGLTITIDPYSKKVVGYWSNWFDGFSYPSLEGVISKEEAQKLFEEKAGVRLIYHRQDGWQGIIQNPKLVYLPNVAFNMGVYIDAKKGELISPWSDQKVEPIKVEDLKPLLSGEVAPRTKPEKPLTMDEALKVAESFVSPPEGYELRSRRYNESWRLNGTKTWSFEWSNEGYKGSINVSVDAVSGEVTGFNFWDNKEMPSNTKANYTWEEGREKAAEFVKKVSPEKAKELTFNPDNVKPIIKEGDSFYPRYNYSLVRLVDGVPYIGSNVNIEVDATTGKVVSYWSSWEDLKFPSTDNIISNEEALAMYLKNVKFELRYIRVPVPENSNQIEYKLVYTIGGNPPQAIDANTGEVVDLYNYKIMETVSKEVGNHWARNSVVALASAGIVEGDGTDYKLNEKITRAEFAKLVVSVAGVDLIETEKASFKDVAPDKWYYQYVETAAKEGLVTGDQGKFRPNDTVTRQEMAVMLSRLLDKGEGSMDSTSNLDNFKDASKIAPWAETAFAKLTELGIIGGDPQKNLRPTDKLTRAEAMNVIFKLISGSGAHGKG